jgi:hypothetical protein
MALKLKASVFSGTLACAERCAELPEERKRKRGHLWRDQHHAGEAPSCLRENRQGKPSQVHVFRQGQGFFWGQRKHFFSSEHLQYKYPFQLLLNKEKRVQGPFYFRLSNESIKNITFTWILIPNFSKMFFILYLPRYSLSFTFVNFSF